MHAAVWIIICQSLTGSLNGSAGGPHTRQSCINSLFAVCCFQSINPQLPAGMGTRMDCIVLYGNACMNVWVCRCVCVCGWWEEQAPGYGKASGALGFDVEGHLDLSTARDVKTQARACKRWDVPTIATNQQNFPSLNHYRPSFHQRDYCPFMTANTAAFLFLQLSLTVILSIELLEGENPHTLVRAQYECMHACTLKHNTQ